MCEACVHDMIWSSRSHIIVYDQYDHWREQ